MDKSKETSEEIQKTLSSTEFALMKLLQYMTDQKIPKVARIKEFIPTIEKRAHMWLNDFLGKDTLHTPIQTTTI